MKRITLSRRRAWVALVSVLFYLVLDVGMSEAAARSLFLEVKGQTVSSEAGKRRGDVRKRRVKVDFDAVAGAGLPLGADALELNLFADISLTVEKRGFKRRDDRHFTWSGSVPDDPGSMVILVVGDGQMQGTIFSKGKHYSIREDETGAQEIVEIDQSAFPREKCDLEATGDASQAAPTSPALQDALADSGSSIDVLVVYTPSARSAAGGATAIQNLAQLAVDTANTSYANSGIAPRLSLAHTAEMTYTEQGWNANSTINYDLNNLKGSGDGYLDNVHTLRDTYHADVVILLINDQSYCGLASSIMATSADAFALVHWDCTVSNYSFGHEIGHLQGARHDRYVDTTNGWTVPANLTYNHGDVDLTLRKRTVMAYNDQCAATSPFTACTRVPYWSNPNVSYPGSTRATGGTTYENNTLVLNNTASTVANFRQAAPTTAQLTVSSTAPASGVSITASPADNAASSGGTTTFTLTYNVNTSVTLTAPATVAGYPLSSWTGCAGTSGTTCTVTVDAAKTVTANYAVNHAPSFVKGANQTVLEDAGAQTVAGWATGISTGAASESAQVLTFTATNDNNGLFSTQPAVAADGTLTYTAAGDTAGSATVTVSLKDDGGTANGGSDTSASQSFTITVTGVNDSPVFVKGADQVVLEDAGAQAVVGWATGLDAGAANESAQLLAFTVTNSANALFSVQPAVAADGSLTYTPTADKVGTATVTVVLTDNGGNANGGSNTSISQSFTVTVRSVNDAPSFLAGASQVVFEDAGAQSVAGWATGISAGPASESAQVLTFAVSSDNSALFSVQPAVSADGTLTYTPGASAEGSAIVTVVLKDNGGTANGGSNASAPQSFTLTVTGVNDAPAFVKGADQVVLEDAAAQTVAGWAQGITAGAASESAQILKFTTTNSKNGMFSGQPAVAADGTLTYAVAADKSGVATVTVVLSDDGGTANGGSATSAPQSFIITVRSVNDAPGFLKGADQTVLEDAGAQTVAGWATGMSAGPTNESVQTLAFTATNNAGALFSVQPAVAADGTLTYTTAADKVGSATVSVVAKDSGGIANGGSNASAPQSFTITVRSVNDAPSFLKGADQTVFQDAGAQTVAGWATSISVGPAGESAQVPTFSATNDNNGLFGAQPEVAANGTLTYTPGAGKTGVATVTVVLKDGGGIANGGSNTSSPQVFTVTVSQPPAVSADQALAPANGVAAAENVMTAATPSQLQEALTVAQNNGRHDLIRLAAGTYALSGNADVPFTYASAEDKDLVIEGGWTPDFSLRASNLTTELRNDVSVATSGSGGVLGITAGGNVTLEGLAVSGGVADGAGGGLFVRAAGSIVVGNCKVQGNTSTGDGGGLFLESTGGDLWLYGSSIKANRGTSGGGGLIKALSVTVYGNEISGNAADAADGGLQASVTSGGMMIVSNNTIYGNQAPSGSSGLSVAATGARAMSVLDIHNNIVYGNGAAPNFVVAPDSDCVMNYLDLNIVDNDIACYEMCPEYLLDGSNTSADFSGRGAGSIRLEAADTALIDRGSAYTVPAEDFEGDALPLDGDGDAVAVPDIGADEYNPQNVAGPATMAVSMSGTITAVDGSATITVNLDRPAKRDLVLYLATSDSGVVALSQYLWIGKASSSAQALVKAVSGARDGVFTISVTDPSGQVAPGSQAVTVTIGN